MNHEIKISKPLSFRIRKFVLYSLILCILLIQTLIGVFFYTEFVNQKNQEFIVNQLMDIKSIKKITDESKKELLRAQDNFQKYMMTNDKKYLKDYFESVNRLTKNFETINQSKNPRLANILKHKPADTAEFRKLKVLVDSTYKLTTSSRVNATEDLPNIEKVKLNYNYDRFDIKTQTFSEEPKKKGFLGRIGDAFSGKENVKKEKTIITLRNGKPIGDIKSYIKKQVDSILNSVNNHYTKEVQLIKETVYKNQKDNSRFYQSFNNLLVYGNDLMNVYDSAIRNAKSQLENELQKQNSESNKTRNHIVLGALILMFVVSILIMYLTRISFIYERKLNEANQQIRENLNFKGRLLGMLSHELRSPLKIIGIFISRINKKTEDTTIKEYLKSISFTNDSLLIQANQILDYTKNQNKKNHLVPGLFNLKDEIESILTSIEAFIETRNNEFVAQVEIASDLIVFSDKAKINQVFMNVLGNANKFTENGRISVFSKTEVVDDKTISLITEISDTGAGISKSDLKKIFEPYYQGTLSQDVENLGAGLGLSLCKEIVELFSGNISAESEVGKGTTVKFSINLSLKQ